MLALPDATNAGHVRFGKGQRHRNQTWPASPSLVTAPRPSTRQTSAPRGTQRHARIPPL